MFSQLGGGNKKPQTEGRKTRRAVFRGHVEKSSSGLTAKNLTKNNKGTVVSVKQHNNGKKNTWMAAVIKAKKELGIKKGDDFKDHIPKKGSELYKRAKEIHSGGKAKKAKKTKK
tara:strand:- start:174 stop:515 length:342 start_codon:yes stop_codon:yes gene_type:complete